MCSDQVDLDAILLRAHEIDISATDQELRAECMQAVRVDAAKTRMLMVRDKRNKSRLRPFHSVVTRFDELASVQAVAMETEYDRPEVQWCYDQFLRWAVPGSSTAIGAGVALGWLVGPLSGWPSTRLA